MRHRLDRSDLEAKKRSTRKVKLLSTLTCLYLVSDLSAAQSDESKRIKDMIDGAKELRTLMQSDPHRPIYHFVAPEGGHTSPFDPNGAIYWKGKYHLGFLHHRPSNQGLTAKVGEYTIDAGHTWGHAVSTDLIHWTLYPDTKHSIRNTDGVDLKELKEFPRQRPIMSGRNE